MPVLHFTSEWFPLPTGREDGMEIFAVGDVHGYCSHLQTMLEVFSEARDSQKQSILVSLGDLIDRGPESIRALDLMRKSKDFGFTETHTLMGNHEQLMRLSLTGKKMTEFTRYKTANAHTPAHEIWSWNGAGKTLRELGLNPEDMLYGSIKDFAYALNEGLGPEIVAFLESLLSHKRIGSLLFVHAGIDPNRSIEEALAEPWDCLYDNHWSWIRGEFLFSPFKRSGLIAVHGHTYPGRYNSTGFEASLFKFHEGKINLDGGSYNTGKIAGAQFAKEKYRIFIVSE